MGSSRSLFLVLLGIALSGTEAVAYQAGAYPRVAYTTPPNMPQLRYGVRPYPAYRPVRPALPTWRRPILQLRYGSVRTPFAANPPSGAKPGEQVVKPREHKILPEKKEKTASNDQGLTGNKQDFISRIRPLVIRENQRLETLRDEVQGMLNANHDVEKLGKQDKTYLRKLARDYRIEEDPVESPLARQELLDRIDIIPVSLALAQAANESAWGQSRFAREGLNLFGIWTYDESKGIVPKNRPEGQKHLVRKFTTLQESVGYYMHTLNSHPAYTLLRDIRSEHRSRNSTPEGTDLAEGLEAYSAKGKEYIKLIRQVIRQNKLALLDNQTTEA